MRSREAELNGGVDHADITRVMVSISTTASFLFTMKLLTPVLLAVLATLSSAATISPQLYIQSNSAQTTSTDLIQVCGDASDLLT